MLSLVIPFYNEEEIMEEVIHSIVEELVRSMLDYELVLVDNGSEDRTGAILERIAFQDNKIMPLHIKVNRGYGHGVIEGLKQCRGEYLGFMCGDGQIRPECITAVFSRLLKTEARFCKVRRVERKDDLPRRIITVVYNFLFPLLFRVKVRDINGTPKIFTRGFYKEMQPTCRDWFIDAEMVIRATRAGVPIEEVPVTFHERSRGKSKIGLAAILEFLRNMFIYRLKGFEDAV